MQVVFIYYGVTGHLSWPQIYTNHVGQDLSPIAMQLKCFKVDNSLVSTYVLDLS